MEVVMNYEEIEEEMIGIEEPISIRFPHSNRLSHTTTTSSEDPSSSDIEEECNENILLLLRSWKRDKADTQTEDDPKRKRIRKHAL